jgi:hypothetical protein
MYIFFKVDEEVVFTTFSYREGDSDIVIIYLTNSNTYFLNKANYNMVVTNGELVLLPQKFENILVLNGRISVTGSISFNIN